MRQNDIAAMVGVARKTFITHPWGKLPASLEPGKSTGARPKTTSRQERALTRMVHEARLKSARALTEKMRNLYGVRVGP